MKAKLLIALLALVLAVAGSTASSAEGTHQDGDHHDFSPLGDYGATGPIERSDLPFGVSENVSDQAIELAQSETFADARSGWKYDTDFVDQIDYQLDFRSEFDFLSSSPKHVAEVMAAQSSNIGSEQLGLILSDSEAAELERRLDRGSTMEELTALFTVDPGKEGDTPTYDSAFGGVWQDHMNGGQIVLEVVEGSGLPEAIEQAIADNSDVVVVEQRFGRNEVIEIKTTLWDRLRESGLEFDVREVRSAEEGTRIEVVTPDPSLVKRVDLDGLPEDSFTVVPGAGIVEASNPQVTHSTPNMQPGLAVAVGAPIVGYQACGWGVNGHTSSYNYLVSASHCLNDNVLFLRNQSAWFNSDALQVRQTFSSSGPLLTSSSTFLKSVYNGNDDFFRASSPRANTNCYHGTSSGDCQFPIQNRTLHNYWEIGDVACASLSASNTYRCGTITEENVSGRSVRTTIQATGGDSGSGVKYSRTFDGIIYSIDGSRNAVFNTAWDVKNQLGFDFNCAPAQATKAANQWGECPAVDR